MICERCRDPDNLDVTAYTLTKASGETRKTVLCDGCADITRTVHKLTGGKAPEAKPSAPEPVATETDPESTEDEPAETEPAAQAKAPSRRR